MKTIITTFGICFAGLTLMSFVFITNKDGIKLPKSFNGKFSRVPAGKVMLAAEELSVDEFYISKEEVTNREYRQFLTEIAKSEYRSLIKDLLVDSANWEQIDGKAYAQYYHVHPAYDNYPVVNISYEAATFYCKWLTETANKTLNSEVILEYKLPTRAEWIKAAQGNMQRVSYSWGGPAVRNAKGQILANFKILGAENIHFDPATKSYKIIENLLLPQKANDKLYSNNDVTAPTKSYAPNDFGLYNMNGNVAEMLFEKGIASGGSWNSPGYDIRNESIMSYEKSSPMVGFRPIVIVKKK